MTSPDGWKEIAIWLADCEAATCAELALKKSASKSEKRRHALICERASAMLRIGAFMGRPSRQDSVLERLDNAVQACKEAPREGGNL